MMDVFPILSTPLGVIQNPYHKEVKSLILNDIATKSNSTHTNTSSDYLYHVDYVNILLQDKYKKFREWIEEQGKGFVKDIMGHYLQDTMTVTDSWINVCNKGGVQQTHNHTNSFISCVYYVNFHDSHAPTYFVRKESMGATASIIATYPNIFLPFEQKTIYNQVGELSPNEGDLVLFPSNVLHGYKKNSEDDRITLALNMMPNVVTGWDYGWRVQPLSEEERLELYDKRESGDIWLFPDEVN